MVLSEWVVITEACAPKRLPNRLKEETEVAWPNDTLRLSINCLCSVIHVDICTHIHANGQPLLCKKLVFKVSLVNFWGRAIFWEEQWCTDSHNISHGKITSWSLSSFIFTEWYGQEFTHGWQIYEQENALPNTSYHSCNPAGQVIFHDSVLSCWDIRGKGTEWDRPFTAQSLEIKKRMIYTLKAKNKEKVVWKLGTLQSNKIVYKAQRSTDKEKGR